MDSGKPPSTTVASSVITVDPSSATSMKPRVGLWIAAVAVVASFAAFILPFLFPPTYPTAAGAYAAGFNSRVAIFSLAAISLFVALASASRSLCAQWAAPGRTRVLPKIYLWCALAASLVFVGGLSWLTMHVAARGVEDYYFIPQLRKVAELHRHLYSQVDFNYGPLLFYPVLWIRSLLGPMHLSVASAYYLTLVVEHFIGLGMLYLVINRLPLSFTMRKAAFILMATYGMSPLLGLQYTLMRFMAPFTLLVLIQNMPSPYVSALFALAADMLAFSVSPEMGVVFLGGVTFYALVQARLKNKSWLLTPVGAAVGAAIYLSLADRRSLDALMHFSRGGANLVIQPVPYVLIYLAMAVWVAPTFVGRVVAERSPQSALIAGIFGSSLALMPSSLGPAEAQHMTANGMGFFLLCAIAVSSWKRIPRENAIFCGAILWLSFPFIHFTWDQVRYNYQRRYLHERIVKGQKPGNPAITFDPYAAELNGAPFMSPYTVPAWMEDAVFEAPNFVPSHYNGTIGLWDSIAEHEKMNELDKVDHLFVPYPDALTPQLIGPGAILGPTYSSPMARILLLQIPYKTRHQVYIGKLLSEKIHSEFRPCLVLNGSSIWTRKSLPCRSPQPQ